MPLSPRRPENNADHMSSGFFIDRPVFAAVISILIVLGGLVAMSQTPVAQFPEITPPTVVVSASYPGATADVIANTVAAPIEQQVNGVDGMTYMLSSSASNNYSLTVTFVPGTNPDMAQVNVQNRVSTALARLPAAVTQQGVTVQKRSSSFMMAISFYSPDNRYDQVFLNNFTNLYVLDPIKRIPGANLSSMFPTPDLAMRIWLKPDRMAQLGITAQDVANAVKGQNQAFGIGQIGQTPTTPGTQQTFVVTTQGMLEKPAEFDEIMIRASKDQGAIVRLKDVARSELGALDYSITNKVNGKISSTIMVYQQPGANAIQTSANVRKLIEELKPTFPPGMEYTVVLDTSTFTEASIEKVIHTFAEAVVLVVLVVFLFLQSFRATIIPTIAVAVAIIGAYVGIYALGFSTNMLTLFGMILAIGLVVDDAIIVVESVEHHISLGMTPLEASKKAMEQLAGALIAIVLVLVSVFLPVAFLGGMTGTLYKQFAITIAISMAISGVVALTLSPAMAARVLKAGRHEKKAFFRKFEELFAMLTDKYVLGVKWLISHRKVALLIYGVMLGGILVLFMLVPGSFVPEEDQGYIFIVNMMPDAASLERTALVSDKAVATLLNHPAVANVGQVDGYSIMDGQVRTNASLMFATLKPYDDRKDEESSAFSLIKNMRMRLGAIKESVVVPINPPSIPGLGATGGFEFYVQSRGNANAAKIEQVVKAFIGKAGKRPELAGVSTTYSASQQQLSLDVDRERAELLGVAVPNVYQELQAYYGSAYVSQFTQYGRIWQVIMQSDALFRDNPDDFNQIYLKSNDGKNVPVSAMATIRYVPGPNLLTRYNGFPAAKISGNAAHGYSSGQAISAMEEVARETLPEGFGFEWSGQAYEEKKAGGTSFLAFVFGLIVVFLILAAQYEKWSLPLGVLMSVPFAIFGALAITAVRGLENDVYFQVGLVTLIGLSAKNAILIIEFASDQLREGKPVEEAAIEAARLRLRPIVMTSLAFILGCVPMAIASGAGANSLRAIGTGVIGGMLASTLIASFFVPLFFVFLEQSTGIFSRISLKKLIRKGDKHEEQH
jgi:hydrophobe/amphiphile efflux-1 (HAE1) family protein